MSVYEKLMKVQNELHIPKSNFNSFGKYSYRSLEDIFENSKPVLAKYNCAITVADKIVEISGRFYVEATATFIDVETGETVSNTAYAREDDAKKGMDSAQLTGATSSYSRKYALGGLLMLDDCKDADTNENAEEQKNRSNRNTKPIDAPKEPQYITDKDREILTNLCKQIGRTPEQTFRDWPNLTVQAYAAGCENLRGLIAKKEKKQNG